MSPSEAELPITIRSWVVYLQLHTRHHLTSGSSAVATNWREREREKEKERERGDRELEIIEHLQYII